MIDLNKYIEKYNECLEVHKYVKRKVTIWSIVSAVCGIMFLGMVIYMANTDTVNAPLIITLIVSIFAFIGLMLYAVEIWSRFSKGNYQDLVFNILNEEGPFIYKSMENIKAIKPSIIEKTNFVNKNTSFDTYFYKNVYDQNDIVKEKCSYLYMKVTISKEYQFSGYMFILPFDKLEADAKVSNKNINVSMMKYKKIKSDLLAKEDVYTELKDNTTSYQKEIIELYNKVKLSLEKEFLEDLDISLNIYNKHLTIFIKENTMTHKPFKIKMQEEKLIELLEQINKDVFVIVNNIIPILEEVEYENI